MCGDVDEVKLAEEGFTVAIPSIMLSINTLRAGSFKLFKRPFPGFFLTILTL